jgi:hypothetical protein
MSTFAPPRVYGDPRHAEAAPRSSESSCRASSRVLSTRVSPRQAALIEQAAGLAGRDVSEFIRSLAVQAAERITEGTGQDA